MTVVIPTTMMLMMMSINLMRHGRWKTTEGDKKGEKESGERGE